MADAIFNERRLAEIYDPLDPDRSDLDAYLALVGEFQARSVLDVGCGTGTLACLLAQCGVEVVAVDPAQASLEVARLKPGADRVRWIAGDASALPDVKVELAVMTANVAQVFLTDEAWDANLLAIHEALRTGGHLAFETRDPDRKAWLGWTREDSFSSTDIAGVGTVDSWVELTSVVGDLVSFRWTFVFASDGAVMTSDSTLRFHQRGELTQSLLAAGFVVDEVREAPDRPGAEFVFVAHRDT